MNTMLNYPRFNHQRKKKVDHVNQWQVTYKLIFLISIIATCIGSTHSIILKGTYQLCNTETNKVFWNEQNDCGAYIVITNSQSNQGNETWANLSKMHDTVSDESFQCMVKIHKWRFYESLFGYQSQSSETTNNYLSKNDCENLVRTKDCFCHKMSCAGKTCYYVPQVKPEYKWFNSISQEHLECHFTPRLIIAKRSEDFSIWSEM